MKLTIEELKRISSQAAFLKERLEGKTLFENSGKEEKRFELWKSKAGGSGKDKAFMKRLEADGITLERAKEIADDVVWNDQYELPNWSEDINSLLQMFPADEKELKAGLLFKLDKYLRALKERTKQNEKVFTEAKENMLSLLPFIYYAEKQLENKMGDRTKLFSDRALSHMSEMLAKGLFQLTYKTISERLRIFILRKESFGFLMNLKDEDSIKYITLFKEELLAGGWKEIFLEYPVLPRIMTTVINNWINNMDEFSTHLKNDTDILENEFNTKNESNTRNESNTNAELGKVKSVKGSISDSHNKGKGVIISEFESGTKIVYKPRNLQIDTSYISLVEALKEMGFPYEIIAPKALNFENHGWIEFIEYKALDNIEQAKDFYKRAGALLCLVYALGGNDFHGENIIACGEHPVLIDLETIIAYKMIQFNEEYKDVKEAQDFVDLLQESVLGLGFLPMWLTAPNDVCIDFGALTGSIATSIPSYDGKQVNVFENKNELLEGFNQAYDFFIANKETFFEKVKAFFNESVIRIILRPTNVYAKMLNYTLNPEYLKDGFLYSIEIERFAPAYLIKVEDEKVKKLWDIYLYERDALEERDIPIFYGSANERHIKNSEGVLYEDYFMDSVVERIRKKLLKLDNADKERQLDFIRESLAMYKKGCHHEGEKLEGRIGGLNKKTDETYSKEISLEKDATKAADSKKIKTQEIKLQDSECLTREEILTEAKNIYNEILAKAVCLADEGFSWISYQHDLVHNKTIIGQTTAALYDGVVGISLFASALFSHTGDEAVKRNALLMLVPFRKSLRNEDYKMPVYRMPSGLGKGLGGIIKALILISDYLDEKSLYYDALYLIDKINKEQIKKEKHMNVLNGLAGLMQGLLMCYEKSGHEYSLELAELCGKQIMKNSGSIKKVNFGYDSSGIIKELANLYSITGEDELQKNILSILNSGYNEYEKMIKNKGTGIDKGSYCSGITGIGKMTLEIGNINCDAANPDIEKILQYTLEHPMEYGDHLCCGNSGRLDFLMDAAIRLERPELMKEANMRIHWMIDRKNSMGYYNIEGTGSAAISNPTLFQGLSGVGYTILRSLDPKKLHSIF